MVGKVLWEVHNGQLDKLQRVAWDVAPGGSSSRVFKLDLSGNEWTEGGVNLKSAEFGRTLREVFAAKEVELLFLESLPKYRDYHMAAWDSVVDSIPVGRSRDFAEYADFLEREVAKLKPLWDK